jgi:hypothetical protein
LVLQQFPLIALGKEDGCWKEVYFIHNY